MLDMNMRVQPGNLKRWAFILPIVTSASWLAMLGALFGSWYTSGQPRYTSEQDTQNIAFVSDIGAQHLKPVFITCTSLSMSSYIPSLMFYFYYMSPTRKPLSSTRSGPASTIRVNSLPSIYSTPQPQTSLTESRFRKLQRSLFIQISIPLLGILLSLIGATNLILLTIFDTARFPTAHRLLLPISIISHILGCLVLCGWSIVCLRQYRSQQRQSHQYTDGRGVGGGIYAGDKFILELYAPQIPISVPSLVIKAIVVAIEFCLVALFAVLTWWLKTFDMAAVMEWVVVLMFAGYMLCLIVDLWVLGTTEDHRTIYV